MDAAPAEHPQIGNYKAPPPSGQMSAPPPHGHYGGPPGHFHQHQHQGGPPMHGQHHYHSHSHGHMHQHQHQQHHPSHLHGHSSHLYHQHSAHSMPGQRDLDTLGSGAHAHSIPQISSPNTQIFNHPNETRVPLSPNTERRQGESHALIARLDDFVKQREMDQAQLIFEQIVQTRADSYCHPEVSRRLPDIYLNFAKSSLGKHCHVTPLDLIHSLRRSRQIPDKDFYESMMRILAHRQYFEYAIRVFEEMDKDNIKAEPVTFSCLVNFAVEMNDGVRAKIFFDALCKRQTPSIRAYMQMLRMQSKLKDADEAFRLLKDMEARGVGVDRLAINTALGACVNGNDLEKARQLMSFAKRYHGDRLDIITFNTLLKGYAMSSRVEEAFELLSDMPQYQVQPNEITFNTLMDAAVRSGQYERAWNTLDTMRSSGMVPDKYTWSTLAKGLKRSRDKEKRRACHGLMQMIYEMKPQDAMAVQQMNLYEFVWSIYSSSGKGEAGASGKGKGKGMATWGFGNRLAPAAQFSPQVPMPAMASTTSPAMALPQPAAVPAAGRSRSRSPRGKAKKRAASSSSSSSSDSSDSSEDEKPKKRAKKSSKGKRSNSADVHMSPSGAPKVHIDVAEL